MPCDRLFRFMILPDQGFLPHDEMKEVMELDRNVCQTPATTL